jgi:hypothetical protein
MLLSPKDSIDTETSIDAVTGHCNIYDSARKLATVPGTLSGFCIEESIQWIVMLTVLLAALLSIPGPSQQGSAH